MSEEDLILACQAIGVHVVFFPIHLAGGYVHEIKLIVVDSRLTPDEQRFTLAHEYVHALNGHDGPQPTSVERWVDCEASKLLINPDGYACAERVVGSHPVALAEELHVPVDCVEAYQEHLTGANGSLAPVGR